jgi:hypothetical protein
LHNASLPADMRSLLLLLRSLLLLLLSLLLLLLWMCKACVLQHFRRQKFHLSNPVAFACLLLLLHLLLLLLLLLLHASACRSTACSTHPGVLRRRVRDHCITAAAATQIKLWLYLQHALRLVLLLQLPLVHSIQRISVSFLAAVADLLQRADSVRRAFHNQVWRRNCMGRQAGTPVSQVLAATSTCWASAARRSRTKRRQG